jgi:DNA-3-methyladenine glycosylase I
MDKQRCPWAGEEKIYQDYHDREWGRPVRDERRLWEFLLLEGMQAGLSWLTVLKKRENFRRAFSGFDPEKIALYKEDDMARLLSDEGIIRNRLKIAAAVTNARAYLKIKEEYGDFVSYIWSFTEGRTIVNNWRNIKEVPARTPLSDALSKELKNHGFKFVGTTICYAFLQAVGVVNDHLSSCFAHDEISPGTEHGKKGA